MLLLLYERNVAVRFFFHVIKNEVEQELKTDFVISAYYRGLCKRLTRNSLLVHSLEYVGQICT